MSADIIDLQARRAPLPLASYSARELHFGDEIYRGPRVFRMTGYVKERAAKNSKGRKHKMVRISHYSLTNEAAIRLHRSKIEEVTLPNARKDCGWIIVRECADLQSMDAYRDALVDGVRYEDQRMSYDYGMSIGCFAMLVREPVKNASKSLLIYIFKKPNVTEDVPYSAKNLYFIIHPDGKITHDPNILYPDMDLDL